MVRSQKERIESRLCKPQVNNFPYIIQGENFDCYESNLIEVFLAGISTRLG